MTYNHWLAKM